MRKCDFCGLEFKLTHVDDHAEIIIRLEGFKGFVENALARRFDICPECQDALTENLTSKSQDHLYSSTHEMLNKIIKWKDGLKNEKV